MGIRQIITSDYDGKPLGDNTQPTVITIKTPGQTAKDAESFEVYLSDDDIDQLIDSLRSPEKQIIPKSLPKASAPAGTRKSSSNSELERFKSSLGEHLFPKNKQAARSKEQKWFNSKWETVAEAKPELNRVISEADVADLKQIAPQVSTEADREKLITILESNPSTVNALLLRIVRELMNEDVPS